MKLKKGISLIVLIITIIVVIVLAAVVILTLSKNNPIESAKEATFKEDVRTFQDELDMYILNEYKKSIYGFERTSVNMSGENLVEKLCIPLKYKDKLAVKKGRLVYIGEDEKEMYWAKSIIFVYSNEEIEKQIKLAYQEYQNEKNKSGFSDTLEGYMENKLSVSLLDDEVKVQELEDIITVDLSVGKFCKYSISTNVVEIFKTILESTNKNDNYVGYYADIDDNGTVDGMIFVDLLTGSIRDSQKWIDNNGIYTLPTNVTNDNVNNYYISQERYTDEKIGTFPVISPIEKNREKRFYIMELRNFTSPAYKDENDSSKNYPAYSSYYWYYNAKGKFNLSDTSTLFGTGYSNTKRMLEIWNLNGEEGGYVGATQNNRDIWKHISQKFNEGWFIPSKEEYAALINELGITQSNYNNVYGLGRDNWTSSISNGSSAWNATFYFPRMIGHWATHNLMGVRLATTF